MSLKQQTLANSFDRRPTRRLVRIGSHNANWESIESDDLIELLTDAAMKHSYWQSLLTLCQLSHTFRRIVNAKLDKLLETLRSQAEATRVEHAAMTALSYPKPDFVASKLKWIENVHAARVADPSTFGAYAKYNTTLSAYFTPTVAERLLKYNHTTGFWLDRDELFAWRLQRCVTCRGKFAFDTCQSNFATRMWMTACHSVDVTRTCCPIAEVWREHKARNRAERRADVIMAIRPRTKALSELIRTGGDMCCGHFWVEPIVGIPPEYTLLGASGMDKAELDRLVAAEEATKAVAAAEREAERTAKRDAEVAKLEAAAEAYLSANVPSIPTLSRLQDLEAFYGMGHAIPTRPLPSHRKLPFSQVCIFEIRMRLFRKHVELLS